MKKILYLILLIAAIALIGSSITRDSAALKPQNAISKLLSDNLAQSALQTSSISADTFLAESTDFTAIKTSVETGSPKEDSQESNKSSQDSELQYVLTALEEPKTMYASTSLNIRTGPGTDFEKIGMLMQGEEVCVTGYADSGWYEIQYDKAKAFVSNEYLSDERYIADVILVGDSRFVQMKKSVGKNSYTWVAESSMGYKWFNETAIPKIDTCVGNGSKILINLGVNDIGNLQKYITLVNTKAEEWSAKGATVYYASVNPIYDTPYITEAQVEYFNSQLQSSLSDNVYWIDSHSYLNSIGYSLVDGLHYSTETYRDLYEYYMSCLY